MKTLVGATTPEPVALPRHPVHLIWAQARDTFGRPVIGRAGQIPWHVPEDFKHFKRLTKGHPIVMGSRTWASLPSKPLPQRNNIVLTDNPEELAAGISGLSNQWLGDFKVCRSLPEAIGLAASLPGGQDIWIIGGASVYEQTLPLADQVEVTEIDLVVDGDTFAPELPPQEWRLADLGYGFMYQDAAYFAWQLSSTGIRYRFRSYVRI